MDESTRKKAPHTQEDKAALGGRLATARREAGYTAESAAEALGLVKQTVSSWERGRNLPDALMLRALAGLYRTSVDLLLGLENRLIWPFSLELQDEVLRLDPEEISHMEVALWAHMRQTMPSELHYPVGYDVDPRKVIARPKTILTPKGAPAGARRSSTKD